MSLLVLVLVLAVVVAVLSPWVRRVRGAQVFTRLARELGYSPTSRVLIEVPSLEGRPAYSIRVPSRSSYATAMVPVETRKDLTVLVGQSSVLVLMCTKRLPPGDPLVDPLRVYADEVAVTYRSKEYGALLAEPWEDRIAGTHAVGIRYSLGRMTVTDWHFAHDGWHLIAGFQSFGKGGPEPEDLARVRACLDTLTWADGPAPVGS